MGKRRQSREEALKVLYQIDLCKRKDLVEVFAFHWEQNPSPAEVKEFAQQLVIQTLQQQEEIDTTIQRFSKNWTLDRMSYIDRNILRMAVCELRFMQDIPAKVTINEAIEVAKRFGTEKSAIFINGVLDGIKNELGKV
ncbi:MAG: transcription antitermination factor NusB [Candidatus Tectomicrobia bacterium]|uniref:Transcription antitermination protein NusB n=1 Tax=Tectimicrobiota bacterium TaxID=2528274 RepID=A0A932CN30_UNCTE|nr:transcription antitermination factor NusB [Candidatus Tectomicrobia bacterium]